MADKLKTTKDGQQLFAHPSIQHMSPLTPDFMPVMIFLSDIDFLCAIAGYNG